MAKKTTVSCVLEVRTGRNSNEFEPKTFTGKSYDAILDDIWDNIGMDRLSIDSACELAKLAKIDREKAAEEARKAAEEKAEADRLKEEARKARYQKRGPKSREVADEYLS